MPDRPPAIHTIESLREHLQFALAVEHFTIPPYLCALYSIKEGTNREAASVIQSVVMEEMLHMALVANLLNAVGGEAQVNHPSFIPTYPDYLPHSAKSFQVSLGKFSREAVEVFMKIEQPEALGSAPPEAHFFETIGQFYAAVKEGLDWLCEKEGVEQVFSGKQEWQISPEYYYGGAGEIAVFDLTEPGTCPGTADLAVKEIVDQGEGAPGEVFEAETVVRKAKSAILRSTSEPGASPLVAGGSVEAFRHKTFSGAEEPAHYYRFEELYEGRYYEPGHKPGTGPQGPELPVQWDAVHNMRPNPKAVDYPEGSEIRKKLDKFNRCYMRFLDRLQRSFTGQPSELVGAVGDMYEIRDRAVELMRIPSGHGDTTVGPGFEYVAPGACP